MFQIGLMNVDNTRFPNLALMKLSAYHKNLGDTVEWVNPNIYYDIIYKSKVFTFTNDTTQNLKAVKVISGGTGYNLETLPSEIDQLQPDYTIYPDIKESYGFLTRGCPNKCKFCIVPKKEGNIHPYMNIEEIASDRKYVILMDNNILASNYGIKQIEKIIRLNLHVDFNQGLDARIIASDEKLAWLLSKVKWYKPLRMACDTENMKAPLEKAVHLLRKFNCIPKNYFIYVLLQNFQDSYDRVMFCKSLKLDAFAQPYRNFTINQIIPQWQKDLARYTNLKWVYKTIDFKDFIPRKGFSCKQYFINPTH